MIGKAFAFRASLVILTRSGDADVFRLLVADCWLQDDGSGGWGGGAHCWRTIGDKRLLEVVVILVYVPTDSWSRCHSTSVREALQWERLPSKRSWSARYCSQSRHSKCSGRSSARIYYSSSRYWQSDQAYSQRSSSLRYFPRPIFRLTGGPRSCLRHRRSEERRCRQ